MWLTAISLTATFGLLKTAEVRSVLEALAKEEDDAQLHDDKALQYAWRIARPQMRRAITGASRDVTRALRDGTSTPRTVIYTTVLELFEHELASGARHLGKGELSMEGRGLKLLCERAFLELERAGVIDAEARKQGLDHLHAEIESAG